MGRLEEYINFYNESIKKYGEKTAVLYQCGNFYELYGVNNETEKLGNVEEIADILNIQLTRADKSILENNRKNPLFAGFNVLSLDKFVKILIDNGYTAVIINQDKNDKTGVIVRQIDNIYSPGTYLESNSIENYLISIFFDKHEIGLAAFDISVGNIILYNIYNYTEIDDCYRFVQTYKPKEILITLSNNENFINYMELLDLQNVIYHKMEYNRDYENIKFQNELLKNFYKTGFLDPIEFLNLEMYNCAITAYCILLIFCMSINKSLLENIQDIPIKIWSNSNSLILENNAINQLNLNEVLNLMVKNIKTKMGNRLMRDRLYNPIYKIETLNLRYSIINNCIMNNHYEKIRFLFKSLGDITKLHRKIGLNKLKLNELIDLFDNYNQMLIIVDYVKTNKLMLINEEYYNKFMEYMLFLDSVFNKECNNKLIIYNPFSKEYSSEIYEYEQKIIKNYDLLKRIADKMSGFITSKNINNDFISIDKNLDLGYYLQLTPARFKILKDNFKPFMIDLLPIKLDNFEISKKQASNIKLYGGCINNINKELELDIETINNLINNKFNELLINIQKYHIYYNYITDLIGEIDLYCTVAQISILYKYTEPILIESEKSFIKVNNLRHPLIEQQDRKNKYIPFSLELNGSGILLYGINSSGKSSTMKAIGLAVIMAQAGFFVPVDKMELGVYHNLMTRILNVDNIFKGLSSFAVEMIELRSIINRMSKNSLILGDEICHGTETNSAVSIISAGIILLSKNDSSFIFATHLHKLAEIEEINQLENVKQMHLTVDYDKTTGELVYDRKLKLGPGDSNYGIEVAKFLKISPELINIAVQIRNKYFSKKIQLKSSKYNKGTILNDCGICGEIAVDMHHIYHQSETINDYVDGFYIHDKSNLVPLCELHHNMVHKPNIYGKELIIFGYENDKLKYTFRTPKL